MTFPENKIEGLSPEHPQYQPPFFGQSPKKPKNHLHEEIRRVIEIGGRSIIALLVSATYLQYSPQLAGVLFFLLFIWALNPVLPTILQDFSHQVNK